MADSLVQRAHWGDLDGMDIAGLVRLSFELASTDCGLLTLVGLGLLGEG